MTERNHEAGDIRVPSELPHDPPDSGDCDGWRAEHPPDYNDAADQIPVQERGLA